MLPGLGQPVQGLQGWSPGLSTEETGSAVLDQSLDVSVDSWPPYEVPASLFEPDDAQVALVCHSKDRRTKGTRDHSAEPSGDTCVPACQLLLDPEVGRQLI